MLLFGDEDQAHSPLADLLHQLVRTDHRAGPLGDCLVALGRISRRGLAHELAGPPETSQQAVDFSPQRLIGAASLVQIHRACRRRRNLQGADQISISRPGGSGSSICLRFLRGSIPQCDVLGRRLHEKRKKAPVSLRTSFRLQGNETARPGRRTRWCTPSAPKHRGLPRPGRSSGRRSSAA